MAKKKAPAWPAEQVEKVAISKLTPYAQNSRTHSRKQIEQIKKSIEQFGWTIPVLIDEEGVLIAGHGRVMAAEQMGIEEIPCMTAKGWSQDQKRAYVIADNKLAENADWDNELLAEEMKLLDASDFDVTVIGFSDAEVNSLIGELERETADPEIVFSEELEEMHNYVVLYFSNDIDWTAAQTHFGLDSAYSRRSTGEPWSKGIGRVVDGAKYLRSIKE